VNVEQILKPLGRLKKADEIAMAAIRRAEELAHEAQAAGLAAQEAAQAAALAVQNVVAERQVFCALVDHTFPTARFGIEEETPTGPKLAEGTAPEPAA
jgi:hypothetical protein